MSYDITDSSWKANYYSLLLKWITLYRHCTYVSDEHVLNVCGFTSHFGIKVETTRLDPALLQHRLSTQKKTRLEFEFRIQKGGFQKVQYPHNKPLIHVRGKWLGKCDISYKLNRNSQTLKPFPNSYTTATVGHPSVILNSTLILMFFRVASLALGQSYVRETTLMNMGKAIGSKP